MEFAQLDLLPFLAQITTIMARINIKRIEETRLLTIQHFCDLHSNSGKECHTLIS